MTAAGGCHCGHVRYRVDGAPVDVVVCHCRDCQRQSGATFLVALGLHPDQLVLTAGAPRDYRSSGRAVRSFCPECGTPISFRFDGRADRVSIWLGCLDDPSPFRPSEQIWTESAHAWLHGLAGLPASPRGRNALEDG